MLRSAQVISTAIVVFTALPAQADDAVLRAAALHRPKDATGTDLERSLRPDFRQILSGGGSAPGRHGLAGAPTVQVRHNYVYVEDTDGTLTIPYQTFQDVQDSFQFAVNQLYTVLPDEFQFIYFFTSFETGVGAFFYSPLANNTTGIGQGVHDETGGSPLDGFVFMNYWHAFDSLFPPGTPRNIIDGFSRSVFNQEAGHRWGVIFEQGPNIDARINLLLGRDMSHWSYFVQTGGSPMEGNSWTDNANGSFTTSTDVTRYTYSDVDLYLMGLMPTEMVQPWFVIENPQIGGAVDIQGQPITPASPPQIFSPQTISGTKSMYTIQDLTSRLGQRSPAFPSAPNTFRVVFIMLAGRQSPLNEAQRAAFEATVDGYASGFQTGTRNRGSFDYILMGGPALQPIGGMCTMPGECNPNEANVCATPRAGGATFCSRGCTTAASCPGGWCCGPDGVTGGDVCQQSDCMAPPQPDAGFVADTGVPETPDSGAPGADATVCTGAQCQSSDAGVTAVCTCDLTFGCDPDCACDLECRAGRDGGCKCSAAESESSEGSAWLTLALAGMAIALRRRR